MSDTDFELNNDTVKTAAMGENVRVFGAESSQASYASSYGRASLYATARAALADDAETSRTNLGLFKHVIWANDPEYGAVADWNGTTGTDNAAALALADAAATALGGADIWLSAGSYYVASTITINGRNRLVGQGMAEIFGFSSALIGGLSVSPVLKLDGGGGSRSVGAARIGVGRATGTVPSGAVGVQVTRSDMPVLEDLYVRGHEYAFEINTAALGVHLNRCMTSAISQAHVWWRNGPELSLNFCRFGRNGDPDVACEAYIRIEPIVSASIDTLKAVGTQFNQSGASVDCLIDCVGYEDTNGILTFVGCHAEAFTVTTGNAIRGDVATTEFRRFKWVGGSITGPGLDFFAVDAGTTVSDFQIVAATVAFDVNMGADSNSDFLLSDSFIEGDVSCSGAENLRMNGNHITGAVALSGTITRLAYSGNTVVGSVTNTATVSQGPFITGISSYADDAAAASGGVAVGGVYRTASVLKVRVS